MSLQGFQSLNSGATTLSVEERFAEIRGRYRQQASNEVANMLVYGQIGTGKTYALRTAPKPVLVHSFDPGGTKCLRPWIEKGEIMVDTRFESDDHMHPKAFKLWEDEFNLLRSSGFFNSIGTYSIDSFTFYNIALLSEIIKGSKEGPGSQPGFTEWRKQNNYVTSLISIFASLPCHVYLTGHEETEKDETTGNVQTNIQVTKGLKVILPGIFDEIYVARTKASASGIEYTFQTRNDGRVVARSRLGQGGKLELHEPADIRNILQKCGLSYADKPLLINSGEAAKGDKS